MSERKSALKPAPKARLHTARLFRQWRRLPVEARRALLLAMGLFEAKEATGAVLRLIMTGNRQGSPPQLVVQVSRGKAARRLVEQETCIACGCTEARPCPGGCCWIVAPGRDGLGLCSSCKPARPRRPKK